MLERKFVKYVSDSCLSEGFKFDLRPVTRLVPLGFAGYFDDESRSLVVAAKGRGWFPVLVHEFCHMQQYKEGSSWFGREAVKWETYYDFMRGVSFSDARVENAIRTIQECELDAERRAVRIIHRWGFPSVDLKRYIQCANLNLLEYEHERTTGKGWSKVERRRLFRQMPTKFMRRYDCIPAYLR